MARGIFGGLGVCAVALGVAGASACGSDAAPAAPRPDAAPNLDDWDRAVTRPDDGAAAANRASCKYARGALPAETLGSATPVDRDIPIETIVVVMQENRSFDHYFARLGVYAHRSDIDVAPDSATNPDRVGPGPGASHPFVHADHLCALDTNHEWPGAHLEYDDGKMDGFYQANTSWAAPPPNAPASVADAQRALMWLDERDIPFYYALASTFAIGDRYFSSLLGPTWPNRDYLYMATSRGVTTQNFPDVSDFPYPSRPVTIFDELERRGVRWNIYADVLPPEAVTLATIASRWGRSPLLHTSDYFEQAKAGTLPQVAFVDADFGHDGPLQNDEHPPADVQVGQAFVARVVKALFASPQWKASALFFIYDEHGGFYDHAPPPPACVPDEVEPILAAGDTTVGRFDRLGMRVPFVVVSPFAKRGFVSHVVHDHTSITRFIETKFRLPALTARDANADPLLEMFDFASPPFVVPPDMLDPPIDQTELSWCVATFAK